MEINRLSLEVDGFNQLNLIAKLNKSGISLKNINRISSSKMSFNLHKKDSEKAFAILQEMCYNYKVKDRSDSKRLVTLATQRVGLIIALIIFASLLTLSYGFIWRINITGCQNIDALTVEKELKASGIFVGIKNKTVNKNDIRNIVNNIDGIIESSVEIKGTTIIIDIIEDTLFNPPTTSNFTPIISNYDAEITSIVTTSGTAQVGIGGRVFRGATLISPYKLDAEGNKIDAQAVGKVYGKVAFSKAYSFNLIENIYVRTGKTYVCSDYTIFGGQIFGKRNHNFQHFETETINMNVFENLFIPLKLTQTKFYELREQEKVYDLDERIEFYKNKVVSDIIIKAGSNDAVTSYTLAKITDTIYRINVFVEAEMLIGGNV